MSDIDEILKKSDKAEIIEWFNDNIGNADKLLVVFAYKDSNTGHLMVDCKQIGLDYLYELLGYLQLVEETYRECGEEDI